MDVGNGIRIRNGVAYPVDAIEYQVEIEVEAVRMIKYQLRNAIVKLYEPTRPAVEAVVRYRINAIQSTCSVALTHIANLEIFDAMADVVWAEVQEHPEGEPEDDSEEESEEEPEEQDVDGEEAPGVEDLTSDSDSDPDLSPSD